jgi:hypothetical protein
LGRSQYQQGSEAFAAIQHGITHGFAQLSWRMRIDPMLERLLNLRQTFFCPLFEIESA